MLRLTLLTALFLGQGLLFADDAPLYYSFKCPIDGCILECRRGGEEPLILEKIRKLDMVVYKHSHTIFDAELSLSEHRSIIINDEEVFCQVINHK